ncbi:MAG: diguanylate cyclase [Treponema sp.]|nr:diguanylate cyclase [Treponema sp.]
MNNSRNSVLIIDDQETTIAVLRKILDSEYIIYTAESGTKGIAAAEEYMPDVILLDILMMEMDGFTVISALKNSEKTKNIPVIFITSLMGDDNEAKGLALGAADYITKPFTPVVVKLRIGNQIRLLEQLRTIERLSMMDQLTDLPNRRCFDERFSFEWLRSSREKTPISILLIDLDLFKKYNDSFGHQQGDTALKTIAKVFSGTLRRPGDFAARWGGEEFVILLPLTDSSGAMEIGEQVRKNVEDTVIPCCDKGAEKITISIGVYTRLDDCSKEDFILRADKALYNAKNAGRNAVRLFGV